MSAEASPLETLLSGLPEACKDLRLNLQSILRGTSVAADVTRCATLAAAYFCGDAVLAEALRADAAGVLTDDDVADARAAAALMGMTTVYYRTRKLLAKPTYDQMRPSLRMNR